jgi:hypothetical protein
MASRGSKAFSSGLMTREFYVVLDDKDFPPERNRLSATIVTADRYGGL